MTEHEHSACNLTYFTHGKARYTINNEIIEVKAGDLLVLPTNCVRKAITSPVELMQCFSVDFHLRKIKNEELIPPFPLLCEPGLHKDIIHLFNELTFTWIAKRQGYIIKCNGLFLQIIHRFLELVVYKDESYSGDFRITRVIRYIRTHYVENITVREMAEMVDLNPAYFGVLFRQVMGMSFNHYLMQTRIRIAENMLLSGEYKVSDAAEACGFADVSHFYKQFKLLKGFPPSHCMPKKF